MNKRIKTLFIGLLLCLSITTNGQSTKKIIEDAWIYIGSWDSLRKTENIELVKSWRTPTTCIFSFEKGEYSVSDELGKYKEKGKWNIYKKDNKDFILINMDTGQIIRYEIVSADNSKLKLKRVT
jgi:hypothetical protein